MFKVLIGWTDRNASAMYRGVLPARFLADRLRDRDLDVRLLSTPNFKTDRADAVVIRRGLSDEGAFWTLNMKARGAKVALDFDDDLWRIPRWSASYGSYDRDTLARALFLADVVWVSTGPLCDRVREEGYKGPVRVLPNLLDFAAYPARPDPDPADPVRVLWYGSTTHLGDLERVVEPLARVMGELQGRAELTLWGDHHTELVRRLWGRNLTVVPFGPIEEFPSRLIALRPDICLCPLDGAERFNDSKSAIKFYESTLAGAACVCSDVGPYRDAVVDGETGLLARSGPDWSAAVEELVGDAVARRDLSAAARQQVVECCTWQHAQMAVRGWEAAFLELKGDS